MGKPAQQQIPDRSKEMPDQPQSGNQNESPDQPGEPAVRQATVEDLPGWSSPGTVGRIPQNPTAWGWVSSTDLYQDAKNRLWVSGDAQAANFRHERTERVLVAWAPGGVAIYVTDRRDYDDIGMRSRRGTNYLPVMKVYRELPGFATQDWPETLPAAGGPVKLDDTWRLVFRDVDGGDVGGDIQVGNAHSTRWARLLPDGRVAVITRHWYSVARDPNDNPTWPAGLIDLERQTEYMVVEGLDDSGGLTSDPVWENLTHATIQVGARGHRHLPDVDALASTEALNDRMPANAEWNDEAPADHRVEPLWRINTRADLVRLAEALGMRPDWHEPDERGVDAHVHGISFDNAGFRPDEPGVGIQEMHVIITRDGVPVPAVNLATLFAWACGLFE